jgi:purine nucleosidase/pyrimidine-specific ribonucleoside hydrolase
LLSGCARAQIRQLTARPTLAQTETPAPLNKPTTVPIRVLFDDDGSPDGTTALLYLLSHPQVEVLSVSISYGEAHPEVYIQHMGRMLEELGITSIPLGTGQDAPLAGSNAFPEWIRQSSNDFWGLPQPNADTAYPTQDAAELMASVINASTEPVTVFVSGPSTNLAQALRLDPGIRSNIARVYIMGGAVHVPGNINDLIQDTDNEVAEWNVYADPQAAREVFEAGLELSIVPLDATNLVAATREDAGMWRTGGATADFAADIYDMLLDSWGTDNVPVWDVMTAAIAVEPTLCGFEPLHLAVTTGEGPTSGQTVSAPGEQPNSLVCLRPDVPGIKHRLNEVFASQR